MTAPEPTAKAERLATGAAYDDRSRPKGTCRACGSGVALRFVPGAREEGRQAHWIGYCGCGCDQAVTAVCGPDDYRTEPRLAEGGGA